MKKHKILLYIMLLSPVSAIADRLAIDKIYHPYVNAMERELEWRMTSADGKQTHRLAVGKALSDRLFVEGYLTADEQNHSFRLSNYELETRWQLTEQGEYSADWGVVAEVEKAHEQDAWEVASAVLAEKEWRRWVGTANLWFIYEWGDNRNDEFETALSMQARYRYSRHFEPAIELYSGQNTRALGPAIMGDVRFGAGKKLHWETGLIFGLDDKTPDTTLRLLTEFEF